MSIIINNIFVKYNVIILLKINSRNILDSCSIFLPFQFNIQNKIYLFIDLIEKILPLKNSDLLFSIHKTNKYLLPNSIYNNFQNIFDLINQNIYISIFKSEEQIHNINSMCY